MVSSITSVKTRVQMFESGTGSTAEENSSTGTKRMHPLHAIINGINEKSEINTNQQQSGASTSSKRSESPNVKVKELNIVRSSSPLVRPTTSSPALPSLKVKNSSSKDSLKGKDPSARFVYSQETVAFSREKLGNLPIRRREESIERNKQQSSSPAVLNKATKYEHIQSSPHAPTNTRNSPSPLWSRNPDGESNNLHANNDDSHKSLTLRKEYQLGSKKDPRDSPAYGDETRDDDRIECSPLRNKRITSERTNEENNKREHRTGEPQIAQIRRRFEAGGKTFPNSREKITDTSSIERYSDDQKAPKNLSSLIQTEFEAATNPTPANGSIEYSKGCDEVQVPQKHHTFTRSRFRNTTTARMSPIPDTMKKDTSYEKTRKPHNQISNELESKNINKFSMYKRIHGAEDVKKESTESHNFEESRFAGATNKSQNQMIPVIRPRARILKTREKQELVMSHIIPNQPSNEGSKGTINATTNAVVSNSSKSSNKNAAHNMELNHGLHNDKTSKMTNHNNPVLKSLLSIHGNDNDVAIDAAMHRLNKHPNSSASSSSSSSVINIAGESSHANNVGVPPNTMSSNVPLQGHHLYPSSRQFIDKRSHESTIVRELYTQQKDEGQPSSSTSNSTETGQRLSNRLLRAEKINRLKRAERFEALKTSFEPSNKQTEGDTTSGSSTSNMDWVTQQYGNSHPIFGYSKHPDDTLDDSSDPFGEKRAERFQFLKTTFEPFNKQMEGDTTSGSSTSNIDLVTQQHVKSHPIFGYSKHLDDILDDSSDPFSEKRAERFQALKTTFESFNKQMDGEITSGSSTSKMDWATLQHGNFHPTFGYSTHPDDTLDDSSDLFSEKQSQKVFERKEPPALLITSSSSAAPSTMGDLTLEESSDPFSEKRSGKFVERKEQTALLITSSPSSSTVDDVSFGFVKDIALSSDSADRYLDGCDNKMKGKQNLNHGKQNHSPVQSSRVSRNAYMSPIRPTKLQATVNASSQINSGSHVEKFTYIVSERKPSTPSPRLENIFQKEKVNLWTEENDLTNNELKQVTATNLKEMQAKQNETVCYTISDKCLKETVGRTKKIGSQEQGRSIGISNDPQNFQPLNISIHKENSFSQNLDSSFHHEANTGRRQFVSNVVTAGVPHDPLYGSNKMHVKEALEIIIDDDEDDIFFGLEEDTPRSMRFSNDDTFHSKDQAEKETKTKIELSMEPEMPTMTARPIAPLTYSLHESLKNLPPPDLSQSVAEETQRSSPLSISNMTPAEAPQNVLSSTSRKSRFRPTLEDTIAEEPHEDDKINCESAHSQQGDDDESTVDGSLAPVDFVTQILTHHSEEEAPPPRSFFNFGCSLVNTFKNSFPGTCQMQNLKQQTWMKAEDNVLEINKLERNIDEGFDLNDALIGQFIAHGEYLPDRTDFQPWEELETQASEDEQNFVLRRKAQLQLLKHVQKAIQIHGKIVVAAIENESCASSYRTEETLPKWNETVPVVPSAECSRIEELNSPASTNGEQLALEAFIAILKNQGVEVLKLGRRNNWQIRYLTVSRESSMSESSFPQVPRALLWLKQFKAETHSINSIREKGRGGVLFSQLISVELVHSNSFYLPVADSIYQKILPKKMQPKFPTSCGVVLSYMYDNVTRKLLLCFKTEGDAKSFCTSITIIKKLSDQLSCNDAYDAEVYNDSN